VLAAGCRSLGHIPVLQEGDFTLYESRAIARYINDTRGNKLMPTDAKARAIVEQWISIEQSTITPDIAGICIQRCFVSSQCSSTQCVIEFLCLRRY